MGLRSTVIVLSLGLLSASACSSSHAPGGDAGRDGGPAPRDAGRRDAGLPPECGPCPRPCCTRDPVSGATVAPFCPPAGLSCEGPPPPPPPCAALGEAGCVGTPGCAPLYDDDCCPVCRPRGGCADCTDPAFFECLARELACSPAADLCGRLPPGTCEGAALDCSSAVPNPELGSCDVPGCVPAIRSGCPDCAYECHPIAAGMCTIACRRVEPPCEGGWRGEADGSCYTDFCIPPEICGGG